MTPTRALQTLLGQLPAAAPWRKGGRELHARPHRKPLAPQLLPDHSSSLHDIPAPLPFSQQTPRMADVSADVEKAVALVKRLAKKEGQPVGERHLAQRWEQAASVTSSPKPLIANPPCPTLVSCAAAGSCSSAAACSSRL